MTKLHDLFRLGQSIWYDNLSRDLLESGEMQALIAAGIVGVTSNPSIFKKAIADSHFYDADIRRLAGQAEPTTALAIYEALALEDIARTADLFWPVYQATDGLDGYVSLEVNPALAHDTPGTIAEARRWFHLLQRPNIMIKVPATPAGIPALTALIGEGINVNVTLMFSLSHYEQVAQAYIRGLQTLVARGGDVHGVASVASFFVSRIDSQVDKLLAAGGHTALQGKIAIANAKLAYARFQEIFAGAGWQVLAGQGARVQRPLWASTSSKNPAYPDTIYVDPLIGPHTINTLPPHTVAAVLDHTEAAVTITQNIDTAAVQIAALSDLGINFDAITAQLQVDGVLAFAQAFQELLAAIASKR